MKDREFLLGVLWAVWWLHYGHGEDRYAEDILIETVGASERGIDQMQQLARREQYGFKRGFWAKVRRRAAA